MYLYFLNKQRVDINFVYPTVPALCYYDITSSFLSKICVFFPPSINIMRTCLHGKTNNRVFYFESWPIIIENRENNGYRTNKLL